MTHLFLFTIGPVQGFIAQARKTRDLYAGSQILSELIREGMKKFESHGGTIIFPSPDQDSSSQPNRFLGYMTADEEDDLKSIGDKIDIAILKKWKDIADDALIQASKKIQKPTGFDAQIESALETYWVFQKMTNGKDGYHTSYQAIERSLNAIKNARPVNQYEYQLDQGVKWIGERGRKCSMDGERNVKFYRPTKQELTDKQWGYSLRWKLFLEKHQVKEVEQIVEGKGVGMSIIQHGEGLSAVSFVKRGYEPSDPKQKKLIASFDSTADIVLLDVLKELEEKVPQELKKFQNELPPNGDGQLYFEENLNKKYFEKQGLDKFIPKLPKIQGLHGDLVKAMKTHQLSFHSYYAVLLFDGDNMGKWLSGSNLVEAHQTGANLFRFHKNLADSLANFGQIAFDHLSGTSGQSVYAGGDDFLGFVNLEHLFGILDWMRREFDKQVNQQIENKTQPLTFSAGVVIAHYKTPLHVVLDWARATEKNAKQWIHPHGQRKDTLGISVMKASGDVSQAFLPWYEDQVGKQILVEDLKAVTDSLREDFSSKWLRNLDREFALMIDKEGQLEIGEEEIAEQMVQHELKRLLSRSCTHAGDAKETTVKHLLPHILRLLGPKAGANFQNFTRLLYACDFIERHTHDKTSTPNPAKSTKEMTPHA